MLASSFCPGKQNPRGDRICSDSGMQVAFMVANTYTRSIGYALLLWR